MDVVSIFKRITERYHDPIRLGSRCESQIFYRVEDLTHDELGYLGEALADRILEVCSPLEPAYLINLYGGFTNLAEILSYHLAHAGVTVEVIPLATVDAGNGIVGKLKGSNVVLVNDVITTARSCLEAHTRITMMGATVLCWAALVDRTFGPGPVSVVASITGEPVRLFE